MPIKTAADCWPTVDDVRRYATLLQDKLKRSTPPATGIAPPFGASTGALVGVSTGALVDWFLETLRSEGRLNTTATPVAEQWAVLSADGHVYNVAGNARGTAERELYMLRVGNAEDPGEPDARLVRRFVLLDASWQVVPTPGDPHSAPPEPTATADRRSTDVPG